MTPLILVYFDSFIFTNGTTDTGTTSRYDTRCMCLPSHRCLAGRDRTLPVGGLASMLPGHALAVYLPA